MYTRFWQELASIDSATAIDLDARQLKELSEISDLTLEALVATERNRLAQALEAALTALREAERLARESNKSRLQTVADSVHDAAGPIAKCVAALL